MSPQAVLSLRSADEVEALIEANDLSALRSTTEIDGVAVDVASLLDATGSMLDRRLQTLSDLVSSGSLSETMTVEPVSETARSILQQSKFDVGGESLLDQIGALLLAWFDRFVDWLTDALGGPTNAALVVTAVVVAVGIAAFTFLARRRAATLDRTLSFERLVAEGGDPAEYERYAAEAASRGAFDEALRNRFLAGLLRLDVRGRITFRPGLTTWEIADRLSDPRFDHLRETFDDVAYGGRHVDAEGYADAVDTWTDLLAESRTSA